MGRLQATKKEISGGKRELNKEIRLRLETRNRPIKTRKNGLLPEEQPLEDLVDHATGHNETPTKN